MFYDMGSGSTVATIVTYQTVKTKEAGTQPQLQIRGVGLVLHIVLMLCWQKQVAQSSMVFAGSWIITKRNQTNICGIDAKLWDLISFFLFLQ